MSLGVGERLERYELESELGTGGMATVFRARHLSLGSSHAIKVLHVQSPALRARLMGEGRAQAGLRHPNIVSVTDVIEQGATLALVLEYVDGPDLGRYLQANRPPLAEALRLFQGILAGVRRAHAEGFVHRDLKPANILLAFHGEDLPIPKVADFGLVKELEGLAGQTRSGVGLGTPAYMAPEQFRGAKDVDIRADIYSLGCILYELCCGRLAFPQPDLPSLLGAVMTGDVVPPERWVSDLPEDVRRAITGCLQVDRNRRIPDCSTLRAVLAGEVWSPKSQPTLDGFSLDEFDGGGEVDPFITLDQPPSPVSLHSDEVDSVRSVPAQGLVRAEERPPVNASGHGPPPEVSVGPPAPASEPALRTVAPIAPRPDGPVVAVPRPNLDSLPEPQPTGTSSRFWPLLGAGVVFAVLLGVWVITRPDQAESELPDPTVNSLPPEPVPVVPDPAPVAPSPAPSPPPASAVQPVSAAPVAPSPQPNPASVRPTPSPRAPNGTSPEPVVPAPSTPEPSPPVEPEPPEAPGKIVFSGPGTHQVLDASGRVVSAAELPPGRYTIRSTFGGTEFQKAGTVQVRAGQTVALKCNPVAYSCLPE